MNLDEALAVYAYLLNRAPGQRTEDEERAFSDAWLTICHYAKMIVARPCTAR